MKVTWEINDLARQTRLVAVPGEYDAYPALTELTINWISYNHRIPARIAVAGALLFREYLSGEFESSDALMPQLASGIQALCAPTQVTVSPVVYSPNKIEQGNIVLAINPEGRYKIDSSFSDFGIPRVIDLQIVDSSTVAGSSIEPLNNVLRVPSNAWLHAAMSGSKGKETIHSYIPYICVAIMMAHDLDAGIIRLPTNVDQCQDFIRVAELLKVIGFLIEK